MILLNKYRITGIPEIDIFEIKSEKFLKVGFVTKNLGGYANISSGGLNAFEKIKTMGNNIKTIKGNRIM